jgi:DNA-binding transcriptional LysR family regulator
MNLLHLKYAVEVAKTASITKAAENLYMGQPNLSRAIRELEDSLGIEIFKRTSKGVIPTPQGEEFLGYARRIIAQVDEVEELYRSDRKATRSFSISVPRSYYISYAFSEFINKLDKSEPVEIFYKETNAMRVISNMVNLNYNLGIVRFSTNHDKYFRDLFVEKGLKYDIIYEFKHSVVMSKNHPLAHCEDIDPKSLAPYVQIRHPDPFVPTVPEEILRKEEENRDVDKYANIFERGSELDLMSFNTNAFKWEAPIPEQVKAQYGLVQIPSSANSKIFKDVLIYKKDYTLSSIDSAFIDELMKIKRSL